MPKQAKMLPDEDYDGIIIGTDDARLLVFSGQMSMIWAARGAHGENCRPLAICMINVGAARNNLPHKLGIYCVKL